MTIHFVRILAASAWVLALPASSRAADAPPLLVEAAIPLHDTSGRIDHMAIDLKRNRLFVAELGNGTVDVVDLTSRKVIHRIDSLREPQGVGYAPDADILAVASAGDGTVRLFNGADLSLRNTVRLGDDADNVRLDMRRGQFVVGYGNGSLAIIDPASASVTRKLILPGHPEGFQLDQATGQFFVNVPDARQITVLSQNGQSAAWRIPGLSGNFPMALDEVGLRLATVFRSPARLVLLDTRSGLATANIPACRDADDVFFDGKRRRLYVTCGEGFVDVMQESDGVYRPLARVRTASGARTGLFVPELDRLFVAERAGLLGSEATLLILRPAPHG